jgi:hypothetical protein
VPLPLVAGEGIMDAMPPSTRPPVPKGRRTPHTPAEKRRKAALQAALDALATARLPVIAKGANLAAVTLYTWGHPERRQVPTADRLVGVAKAIRAAARRLDRAADRLQQSARS